MGLGEAWPLGGGMGRLVMLVSGGKPSLIGTVLVRATHLHAVFTPLFLPLSLSFGDIMALAFSMEDNSGGNGL